MASFTPFTYQDASDFLDRINPPPSLTSKPWADNYNLTKDYGALNGSLRTPKQTEMDQFWAAHPGIQFSQAVRLLIAEHRLNVAEAARLAAMQDVSLADAEVACSTPSISTRAGVRTRPFMMRIRTGTPITVPDLNWLPLDTTPGHPEYPGCSWAWKRGAGGRAPGVFHRDHVHYQETSCVTSTTHNFARFSDVVIEVDMARIFGGMHYRHSVLQGNVMGRAAACYVLRTRFEVSCLEVWDKDDD